MNFFLVCMIAINFVLAGLNLWNLRRLRRLNRELARRLGDSVS